ncbi:hypothetical protein BD779DRAFT_1674920 [Infundibulicybe gibba]|nr:hypothetical protein BD779DRAFT_1674920 [Infundibulicybe gibba]
MSASTTMDETLGVIFLGNIVAAVLYGIICIQAFIFLRRGKWKDVRSYCFTVSVLWIIDTANLVFITHTLYYYMVSNYGDARALASPTWYATCPFHRKGNDTYSPHTFRSLLALVYVTCTSNLVVRCIFARRAWSMTKKHILLAMCILVPVLMAFGTVLLLLVRSSIDTGLISYELCPCLPRVNYPATHLTCYLTNPTHRWKTRTFAHLSNLSYLLFLGLGSGFVADGIIAVTLCAALWRSRTGFPRTDSIIKTLMLYTINTGLLTRQVLFSRTQTGLHMLHSFCTLAAFVAYAAQPQKFIYLAFYCISSKMYLNSLLAILNGQDRLHERAAATGAANILAKQPVDSRAHPYPPNWSSTQRPPIVVDIHQSVVTSDLESQKSSPDVASLKERHAQE